MAIARESGRALSTISRALNGRGERGPMTACITLAVLPVILCLVRQKDIIGGVPAGTVKG